MAVMGAGAGEHGHEPVMLGEVLAHLALKPGQRVMDCTAGRGGHAVELARAVSPGGMLIALDVDPVNLKYARGRVEGEAGAGIAEVEIRTFHANFAEAADVLAELQITGVDGLLADLGVSTNQLLETKHGLSFNAEAPLDMRLDPRLKKKASDLLAEWDEKRIATVLHEYAQERFAWKIARKIIQTRQAEPILTTGQLARLVRSVVPAKWGQIDPATRTFQALRMAVNGELESLRDFLASVPGMLNAGGRAVFISFHSGEDRLVKQAVRQWEAEGLCEVLTKKPLEPGEAECQRNPRSRSAKLRAVRWTGAGAMRENDQ
ncbi:MAG TPA: 16S rRNA (cytosine(1402)-N(4))-methyltransferase RsmH [Phycisphaerae bacterium]|nr:16S rRNA (cytosine(1402)-N(4))-methyltransferase RsmH [Phycisphaerae bacterium]